MSRRFPPQFALLVGAQLLLWVASETGAQQAQSESAPSAATTLIGPRNQALADGAQAFQAGRTEDGVQLTLEALAVAQGRQEQEAALSNLCSGYLRLRQFEAALKYCNELLARNENAWRAYNTRAMVYLELKQYDKADEDLKRAEAIMPTASTVKTARAIYMDVVHPVAPEVEIDDRKKGDLASEQ